MVSPPRTRTPSADVRSALLDAAAHLLETAGPDALSVRRIAADAHVAPMGVYNHFAGKHGVVEALWVDGFDRLRATMESLAEIDDAGAALIEGFRRYRALALQHPMVYRLMFLKAVPGFEPSAEATWTAALSFEGLVTAVRRAMDAGAVADGDAVQMAQVVWAAVHGWVSLELDGMIFLADAEAGAEAMARSLVAGFRIPQD
jgi:AcrR family transcriptional regulator